MNLDFLNFLPIIIIVVVVVVLGIVFLPMLRGSMQSSKLLQTGVAAKAQILKVWQTGMYVNEQPQLGMVLNVMPDNAAAFQVEAKKVVSMLQIPQFQPGAMLEVKYDPANPKQVAIAALMGGGMMMGGMPMMGGMQMAGMQMGGMPMMAAPAMNPQATEQMLMQLQSVHENIVKNGVQAPAKVLQYMPMSIDVNGNNPVVNLMVEVHPASGTMFNAQIQGIPIAEASVPKYQPGQMITVRYMPNDQTQVSVEHSGV